MKRKGASGDPRARICFVGEAWGEKEEEAFEKGMADVPFVGRTGQLLWQLAGNVGLHRHKCYVTNVVNLRPRNNDISPYFTKSGDFTDLGKPFVEELHEELKATCANVIVPLGKPALVAVCGKDKISEYRGSVLPAVFDPSRKCIPTYHPSYASRVFLVRWVMAFDLEKIAAHSKYPEFNVLKRKHQICTTLYDVHDAVREISNWRGGPVAVDIEEIDHKLSSIAFSADPRQSFVIPLLESMWTEDSRKQVIEMLRHPLEDDGIWKVFHNALYDVCELKRLHGIHVRGRIDDTMVGQHLLYPDLSGQEKKISKANPVGGKRLAFLVSRYTNEPYYKDEGWKWKGTEDWNQYYEYNGKDACCTVECLNPILDRLRKTSNIRTYRRTIKAMPVFRHMVERGILVDQDRMVKVKTELEAVRNNLLESLEAEVTNRGGTWTEKFPNSPKQLAEYFYRDRRPKYRKLKTTDKKAMQRLVSAGFSDAKILLDYRKVQKALSTYFSVKLENGRFMYGLNVCGTKTGRISTGKTLRDTGMNVQNQERGAEETSFRKFLIADPGMCLVSGDYSGAEWWIAAYASGDPNMLEAIKGDPHQFTADLMSKYLGRTVSRSEGKTCNFGFNYGQSSQGFALNNSITTNLAEALQSAYFQAYPGILRWWEKIKQTLMRENRTLVNSFGRHRKFIDRWGDQLFREAYDWEPQSTVADCMIDAFSDERMVTLIDPLAQIHDEVLFQVNPTVVDEAVDLVSEIMEIPLVIGGKEFTLKRGFKVGYVWADMVEVRADERPSEALRRLECTTT